MDAWQLPLWGMAGGFVYAAQALVLELWNDRATIRSQTKAAAQFVIALVTSAVVAAAMTSSLQSLIGSGLIVGGVTIRANVGEVPVALTLGWASNYLWPKMLKWLGAVVERQPKIESAP